MSTQVSPDTPKSSISDLFLYSRNQTISIKFWTLVTKHRTWKVCTLLFFWFLGCVSWSVTTKSPLFVHFCVFQEHAVSTRTAVSLVHVPTMESAALSPAANTRVPVLLVTKVLAASMTQMNVKTRLPCARTQAGVSTPTAPTSKSLVFDTKFKNAHRQQETLIKMMSL